ncbi:MAG TPA: hypothetical protein VNA28_03210 [Solirubrobacteraceae bacterium]|nr:hypothetical protein [Solirubrobacteraceae bacterium]
MRLPAWYSTPGNRPHFAEHSSPGPEPAGGEARRHWRQSNRVLERTQRRLGVVVDRDRGLHHEL